MAAEQGSVGKPLPQPHKELQSGQETVAQGLLSPKPEEETEGVKETSIPAGGFREMMAPCHIKREADESLALQWGSECRRFPKEPQSFQGGWGRPQSTGCSLWGSSEASSPHFQGTSHPSLQPGGEQPTQLPPSLKRGVQGATGRSLARDKSDGGTAEVKTIAEEEAAGTEAYRQRFRHFCYLEAEGPREVCNQLWFLCYQWLEPEKHSKEQILELLILEQFMSILPPETQGWVKKRGPETCAQAVALTEDYLLKQEKALEADCGVSESLLPLQHMEKVVSGLLAEVALYSSKTKKTTVSSCRNDKQEDQRQVPLAGEEQTGEDPARIEQQSPKKTELSKAEGGDFGLSPETAERHPVPAGLKPHKCSECGKRFHQISHLNRHLRIHTGEKPYKCLDCGKSFSQGSCLLGHQRIHTGEKAYSCSYCSKSFIWSSGLHQHEKIHLGEKPYKCLECGKSFHRSSALTDHVRSHTGEKPYTCSDCGKGFSQHSNLIVHRRVHTGEKPYMCSICGKSFTRTALLMAHLRIHTGEKPYKCLVCERSFRERPALTKHKKIHMRENP